MSTQLHPLRFRPVYRDYPWGGRRIAGFPGRRSVPAVCAESWELSDRPDGMSVVERGPWAGRRLDELVRELGPALVGQGWAGGRFPLLVKVIDARERTSLQVHPDAASATRLGGEPKTEMWYALPEMGEGRVLAGLAPGVDRGAFARAIEAGDPERAVRAVDLRAGEAILVPAGRVHAIEAGCFLLEIQQNSDTTLRVFDWGRTGPDGAPRTLHLAEAMEAIDWDDPPAAPVLPRSAWRHGGNAGWEILAGEHFRVGRMELREPWREENDGRSFRALFVEAGAVELTGGGEILTLEHGASALLPAGLRECELRPAREAGAAAASVIVTTRG